MTLIVTGFWLIRTYSAIRAVRDGRVRFSKLAEIQISFYEFETNLDAEIPSKFQISLPTREESHSGIQL